MIIIEEAWKALAKEGMAEYVRYLYKTVRKFFGEAVTVTQEVDDIISSPIVKESIINNSDCKILLDQRKYMNKFTKIQELLGLTDRRRRKSSLSIWQMRLRGNTKRFGLDLGVYSRQYMQRKFQCKSTSLIPQRKREAGSDAVNGETRGKYRTSYQTTSRK